jgi:hypothetical protein
MTSLSEIVIVLDDVLMISGRHPDSGIASRGQEPEQARWVSGIIAGRVSAKGPHQMPGGIEQVERISGPVWGGDDGRDE